MSLLRESHPEIWMELGIDAIAAASSWRSAWPLHLGKLTSKHLRWALPTFALLALWAIYARHFHQGPYVDDTDLLFRNPFILARENPLRYWFRGQPDTKAWPLAHTAYWFFYGLFRENFQCYRLVNLALHWAIGLVVFRSVATRASLPAAAFASIFFWFHPVAIEPVLWIVQMNVLLATLILAVWLERLSSAATPRGSSLYFLGSLAAKSTALFLPVLLFRRRLAMVSRKRAFLETLPSLFVVFYAGWILQTGVVAHEVRARAQGRGPQAIAVPAIQRLAWLGESAVYYSLRLSTFCRFPAEAERPADIVAATWPYVLAGLLCFLTLGWALVRNQILLAAGLLLYLPSSGLFHAPFLAFYLVADRMIYPTLLVLALALGLNYDRLGSAALRRAVWLWPLLLGAHSYFALQAPRADFTYLLQKGAP